MKQTHRRRWRWLLQGLCLYGLLCGFFLGISDCADTFTKPYDPYSRRYGTIDHTAEPDGITLPCGTGVSLGTAAVGFSVALAGNTAGHCRKWCGTALAAADRLVRDHCISRFSENFL